jgi:predicted molibdopterin-dependent oxidoreductase YjgC
MGSVFVGLPARLVDLTVDGREVRVPEGSTILDACRSEGIDTPTLCYLETLTPVNACRVCVVEVEGARALVPACSRRVEAGMRVETDSERVRHSRRMVLELLDSSADLSDAPGEVHAWIDRYGADGGRYGADARTVAQPPTVDNDLYVRDYARCILCYKCVQACGVEAQNTFAIAVAGRGFDARIAVEHDAALTDSACVYCGNCIGVCPTGALVGRSEFELRQAGSWDADRQEVTRTVCPYCGVGCNLELTVQDDEIVRVDSPRDHDVTRGHLCIKGRFGYQHVQNRPTPG